MFTFNDVGTTDVSFFIEKMKHITEEEWCEGDALRRKVYNSIHGHTNTIAMMWSMKNLQAVTRNTPDEDKTKWWDYFECDTSLNDIKEKLTLKYGPGELIRVIMPRLEPFSSVAPHVDKGWSLINCKRVHIPLQTSEKVLFTVGNETRSMKVGEMVEIDNSNLHSVQNNYDQYRIHIIVDWYVKGSV